MNEQDKKHINIDLEFLDKKEPLRAKPMTSSEPIAVQANNKYSWKKILMIIGGVIIFIIWIVNSDNSSNSTTSTTNTYTPTSNDLVTGNGRTFRCSDYNYNRAIELRPNASTVASLASESDTLDNRISTLKTQRAEIDAMYVDDTDQSSLDTYNAAIDDFNAKSRRLKSDVASWDKRNITQNNQIDTFNNFLDTNCTPQ